MVGSPSSLNQSIFGSIKDCGKLPTYPSPDPTFCTKRENKLRLTELGEGWVDEIADQSNCYSEFKERGKITETLGE